MHSRLLPNCRMCTAVQFEAGGQKRLIHCRPICVQTSLCHMALIRLRRKKHNLNCLQADTTTTHTPSRYNTIMSSTYLCIKLVSGIAVLPMFALAPRIGHRSCQWFCNKSITFTPIDWLQILHDCFYFIFMCSSIVISQNYFTYKL